VNRTQLLAQREQARADIGIRWNGEKAAGRRDILVCTGGGCLSSGALAVRDALTESIAASGLAATHRVIEVGCIGLCGLGPLVVVAPEATLYCQVTPDGARRIVEEHLIDGELVEDLLVEIGTSGRRARSIHDIPFLNRQTRIALRNMGLIDPGSITDSIARDGYAALASVLVEGTPDKIIEEVKRSGLRGRGGGGFPTGAKWEFAHAAAGEEKFIVCNADEGDPGAFMDRSLLEGDPHSILEGMAIAGYAVGAARGFIYVRAEYPLAIRRLSAAVEQATELGVLGKGILESSFDFEIEIRIGAGAFVCGEETALLASIEGKRGVPRPRPPFPAQKGLWGKPTVVNNVETFANVAPILLHGADAFTTLGTENSPGTKVFALAGDIRLTGLVEIPMGTPLGEIIYDIGGGIPEGRAFKAAQIGGPSGGCIPVDHLNVPIDYESLKDLDAIMGSGGLVIMDEHTCMVNLTRFFLEFLVDESCGKCVPCRVGTAQMLEFLTRITEGRGKLQDLDDLRDLASLIKATSLCGLGQTAPNALLSTLRFFADEYEAHILRKECPAGICPDLVLAPCEHECPAHVDVPGYVALIGEGRFHEALALHRERNPFPSVCGRVCHHPCEDVCRRRDTDEAIAIRQLKRFIADEESAVRSDPVTGSPPPSKERVAIVGAGPAGLSAAHFLRGLGYRVTVFEALPEAGGALLSIPEYRLPKAALRRDIAWIENQGVEIRTSTRLGQDISLDGLFKDGSRAVLLAIGTHDPHRLEISGEDLDGVIQGLAFVWDASASEPSRVAGKRVAVIGGGNVAIDAARSAVRLGAAETHIVYRRRREEMPAERSEICEAEWEGAELHYLLSPVEVLGSTAVEGLRCTRMKLADFDTTGRRRPIPSGEEQTLDVDIVIVAIGQSPDLPPSSGSEIQLGRGGRITVDPETQMTSRTGVFAAGDAVTGPTSVVETIAAGQQVAAGIDRYLGGEGLLWPEQRQTIRTTYDEEAYAEPRPRAVADELPVSSRIAGFDEVVLGLEAHQAIEEAKRCLHCDVRD